MNLRYEDLVHAPHKTLARLTRSLGRVSPDVLSGAIEACAIDKLRTAENHSPHYWQGKPGLWKKLLTAEAARRIASAQPRSFERLGYRCDPDPGLMREQAEANWDTLGAVGGGLADRGCLMALVYLRDGETLLTPVCSSRRTEADTTGRDEGVTIVAVCHAAPDAPARGVPRSLAGAWG